MDTNTPNRFAITATPHGGFTLVPLFEGAPNPFSPTAVIVFFEEWQRRYFEAAQVKQEVVAAQRSYILTSPTGAGVRYRFDFSCPEKDVTRLRVTALDALRCVWTVQVRRHHTDKPNAATGRFEAFRKWVNSAYVSEHNRAKLMADYFTQVAKEDRED